ncbi:ferritin-like domain-containing protein [Streptoverticillium reticulum]|uniref:ferritin-like domain-containing protein n=1 Tax=Streptoverticillium reticulum TaxID=1433415 RepID=UPI0039BF50CA
MSPRSVVTAVTPPAAAGRPGPPIRTTPTGMRDLDWIRGALQTAIALEHATMPLYSAAMYSLEVQNYPSYNIIRSVLMEEMVHMAAAANMLAALGGSPAIGGLAPDWPAAGLPGGVMPDLTAVLAPLSPRHLADFMRIEAPAFLLTERERRPAYPTIGHFYDALREALAANADAVRRAVRAGGPANQVGGNLGYPVFGRDAEAADPVEQFLDTLDLITDQGEGAHSATVEAGGAYQHEGSHYARFAELRHQRRYLPPEPGIPFTRETEPAFFQGQEIPWPVVINTLAVPSDGYAAVLAADPDAPAARKELDAFDAACTAMMTALDLAWNGPEETSWPSLGAAVERMNDMRVLSCFTIMRRQIPAETVERLDVLYPEEYKLLAEYTDLGRPVFYGPRFRNNAAR